MKTIITINKVSSGYQVIDNEYNFIFDTKKQAENYCALLEYFWKEYKNIKKSKRKLKNESKGKIEKHESNFQKSAQ